MGIGGLLPLLKEIQKPCHVKEWAGKRVAVDSYVSSSIETHVHPRLRMMRAC